MGTKKVLFKCLMFFVIITGSMFLIGLDTKSYYDAKKIYNEVKPAIVDEERAKLREEKQVLILLYHNVTDKRSISSKDDLYVHIDDFRDQLDYIVESGYNVITLQELYDLRQKNEKIPNKTIVLTFDDGDKSSYDIVFPELKKRGLRASFFVTTRQLNEKGFVTRKNLIEMENSGQDIQSQGHNNEDFIDAPLHQVHKSMYLSKKILEETLNKKVLFLVYPNSSFNSEVIRIAQDVGYEWALSTEAGRFYDHYMIMERVSVPGGSNLEQLKEKIKEYGY